MSSPDFRRLVVPLVLTFFLVPPSIEAQAPALRPVTVGSAMPDFTLPVFQGGDLTLSELRGKNVMIIFPRGLSQPDSWCHICPYQHSELVEYEQEAGFRDRANLEIVFVLPYGQQKIEEWVEAYPQLLQDIEDWKNPPNPSALDEAGRRRMDRVRAIYPKAFPSHQARVPLPFPILVDGERRVSEGLGFFTTDWSGSNAEQNVPTVLIIDANGILQFKYMSQNTVDRPPLEYLVQVMDVLNGMGP